MADNWPAVPQTPSSTSSVSAVEAASAKRAQRMDLSPRGTWAMVQRNRDVFLKTWKTNMMPPLLEPLLYIVAIGYGLGMLVDEVDGVSYPRFLAPAILCITMMQSAFFETTYGSFVRMWFQKTWDAVTATPLSLDDVVAGELVWAALKSVINTTLMGIVIAILGLMPWWTLIPMAPLAFVVGLACGGLGMMFSAKVPHIDAFQFGIFLLITPMMLFSGTYFPLAQMPEPAQWIALALPLTHAVALARPLTLGTYGDMSYWSVLYLLVAAWALPALSMRWMRRKLIV